MTPDTLKCVVDRPTGVIFHINLVSLNLTTLIRNITI